MWVEGFEHTDKKNAKRQNLSLKVTNHSRQSDLITKNERLMTGIATWASYYRSNPHKFCEDYLGIELKMFQQIIIFAMMENNYTMYLAARGLN